MVDSKLIGAGDVCPGATGVVARDIDGNRSGVLAARCRSRLAYATLFLLLLRSIGAVPIVGAPASGPNSPAATPPMGWNDWAHYQCGYTAQTIIDNARELVKTGLASRGYNTVTIDDCWMQKTRDASGNLQVNRQRFPHGMKPVSRAIHALGLKFGIYEDAGYATCGGFAGSGQPQGGGKDHFVEDARLFASWGVDYLKLDGCNVYVPPAQSSDAAYRRAYAAEAAALKSAGRLIVFSESAPAYFQGTPQWYDVLSWVPLYGQLWREGTDVAIFRASNPDRSRFHSVLWNYSYNLPLGRFQKPGNWNDADFIIGGDRGMSLAETRSQMALWSMMSAPLILSSDLAKLGPQAVAVLGNRAVIAVDQDSLGRMATLRRRSSEIDVLFKPLSGGDDAVAVLNRGTAPVRIDLDPADLGFAANSDCSLDVRNLWNGVRQSAASGLQAEIVAHDTAIWRVRPSASCGRPARTGTIIMISPTERPQALTSYTHCLAAPGRLEICHGAAGESWTVAPGGVLRSSHGLCLAVVKGKPAMEACRPARAQRWRYTLKGNLISAADHHCLTAASPDSEPQSLQMQPCGYNLPNQIWSLPN
jgi:alpha-galactosidase